MKLCAACEAQRAERAAAKSPRAQNTSSRAGDDSAAEETIVDHGETESNFASYAGFAGFWLRVFAYLIDVTLLAVPSLAIGYVVTHYLVGLVTDFIYLVAAPSSAVTSIAIGVIIATFATLLLQAAISFLYFPFFESSMMQATPGKWFFKLVVVDTEGDRLSIAQALRRNFARWVPMVPAFVCLILAVIFGKVLHMNQTAAALVAIGMLVSAMISIVHYPLAGVTPDKQALHDLLARTYVVKRDEMGLGEAICKVLGTLILFFGVQIFMPSKKSRQASIPSSPPAQLIVSLTALPAVSTRTQPLGKALYAPTASSSS